MSLAVAIWQSPSLSLLKNRSCDPLDCPIL